MEKIVEIFKGIKIIYWEPDIKEEEREEKKKEALLKLYKLLSNGNKYRDI